VLIESPSRLSIRRQKRSKFFVLRGDREEGHQVKRQWKDRTNWSTKLVGEQGILDDAAAMVRGGRDFHFVSTLAAHPLSDLIDAARRVDDDYATFSALISGNKKLRDDFDVLATRWGRPSGALEILRHLAKATASSHVVAWSVQREESCEPLLLFGRSKQLRGEPSEPVRS
jgi:hypothetical protein